MKLCLRGCEYFWHYYMRVNIRSEEYDKKLIRNEHISE